MLDVINLRNYPLDQLYPSPTNPRKRFDEKELQDLAASIKEKGVMQPVLIRYFPGKINMYEIVAGERRFRASKIAEMETIPAILVDLDNIETMQLQIIENLQRQDLHPLEQADGFRQMLNATEKGDHKPWTVDELAAKVGKSRSYIYESMNLSKLSNYAKDKFLEGKFGRDAALLISRIPGEELQKQCISAIVAREMSFRLTKEYIRRDFTFDLTLAKWDKFDEKLLPDTPSCAKCPSRSGNYPELHPDIESPDVCTNTVCFQNKKAAYATFCIQTLPNVIHGEDAKQIAPYSYDSYITGGFERSLDRIYVGGMKASEIFGDEPPEPFLLVDEKNNVGPVYKESEIRQLAEATLAEKIATGEIEPPEQKPIVKDKWAINRERREPLAKTLTDHHNAFLKECLSKMAKPLESQSVIKHLQTEFAQYLDNNVRNEQLFLAAFNCSSLDQLTLEQMLVTILHSDFYDQFEVDYYDLDEDSDEFDPNKQFHECIKSLETATGLAFTPMSAAQAQELNAREGMTKAPSELEDAPAPETPAETPAVDLSDVGTVDDPDEVKAFLEKQTEIFTPSYVQAPVDDDIAPGALPDLLPAESAVDPSPAAQVGESSAPTAPLNNFDKIRLKKEAQIAKKKAKQAQKVSAQADA